MNKTKLTALAVGFTTAAILCSCTDTDQTGSQPDSIVTVTSGQTSEIQTSSEITSPPQDPPEQASQTTTAKQNVSFSQVGDCRKINIPECIDSLSTLTPVSDKLVWGYVGICDNHGNCSYNQIGLIDISSGEFTMVSLPESMSNPTIRKGSDDILCVVDWDSWDYTDDEYQAVTGYQKSMAKVKKDYGLEINEDCLMSDIAFDFNGHKICEWNESIYELNERVAIKIVEGVPVESIYSKSGKFCSFVFGIDENRFVYRVRGYESLPGFGVYDFSSGTNTFLPDTENKEPIGTYDGKIFSVSSAWQTGCESKIYVTDIETMTTSLFTDVCESDSYTPVGISMSEDGSRMAAIKDSDITDDIYTPELCILDRSDGHIIKSYDISYLGNNDLYFKFIDNNTIVINESGSENGNYIMEIE